MPTEEIGIAIANGSARIVSSALAQQFQNQACLGCHAFVYLSIKHGMPCDAFSFPAIRATPICCRRSFQRGMMTGALDHFSVNLSKAYTDSELSSGAPGAVQAVPEFFLTV